MSRTLFDYGGRRVPLEDTLRAMEGEVTDLTASLAALRAFVETHRETDLEADDDQARSIANEFHELVGKLGVRRRAGTFDRTDSVNVRELALTLKGIPDRIHAEIEQRLAREEAARREEAERAARAAAWARHEADEAERREARLRGDWDPGAYQAVRGAA